MQKPLSKSNSERSHFKKRLFERFGFKINNDTYQLIIKAIQTGERVAVEINGHRLNLVASYRAKQSNRVTVWALVLGGITGEIPVAYDNLRKELITTHPDMLTSEKNLD